MPDQVFTLPIYFDYGATLLWGVSGALIAARRGYDLAGAFALALVSATGGGLLRDGLFLQSGPPALVQTPVYLLIVAAAALLMRLIGSWLSKRKRLPLLLNMVDALGLGAYAVVGMQLSIEAGLSLPAVALVGVINAVGGSVLRDVLLGQEPEIFKPGTLMALAAFASAILFLILRKAFDFSPHSAAWPTIIAAALIRAVSVRYDLRTQALPGFRPKA